MAITRYTIRPTGESSVSMELIRSGVPQRKHVLFFQNYQGDLTHDPGAAEHTSITLTLRIDSIVCRDAWLSTQARQQVVDTFRHLFDAEHCPQLVFRSESPESVARHRTQVAGALTLRGVTKPANLETVIVPVGKDQLELDAKATLGLSEFGIQPPSSWFGLRRIKDAARLRFLLWPARIATSDQNHSAAQAASR